MCAPIRPALEANLGDRFCMTTCTNGYLKIGWCRERGLAAPGREDMERALRPCLLFRFQAVSSARPMILPCWMNESIRVSILEWRTFSSLRVLVTAMLSAVYSWTGVRTDIQT